MMIVSYLFSDEMNQYSYKVNKRRRLRGIRRQSARHPIARPMTI